MKRKTIADQEHEVFSEIIYHAKENFPLFYSCYQDIKRMIKQQIIVIEEARKVVDEVEDKEEFAYWYKRLIPKDDRNSAGFITLLEQDKPFAFYKWLDAITEDKYYVYAVHGAKGYFLMKQDFNLNMILNICRTDTPFLERYIKQEWFISIEAFSSFKKGEGYKAMNDLREFAQENSIPLFSWAEIESHAEYLAMNGFKNFGQLGLKKEYFMVYEA